MNRVNRNRIGIFLSLFFLLASSACKRHEDQTHKLVINEVLVENNTNFQDDYGVRSGWIEIFNRSFGSADLAGYRIAVSSTPGDTTVYVIPKGDFTTVVRKRQHALFWADQQHTRGTYHTNLLLNADSENWIGLYDSGRKLVDQVVVPKIAPNCSYARVVDASPDWEVKDNSAEKYITPSTNNKIIEGSEKMENFQEKDALGIGMAITAMLIVFVGLIILYLLFRAVGGMAKKHLSEKAEKKEVALKEEVASPVPAPIVTSTSDDNGAIIAAISMALHEAYGEEHDVESFVLTLRKGNTSPWSAKDALHRAFPTKK